MSHRCPVKRNTPCTAIIKDGLLMCLPHWKLVPKELQGMVYDAYQGGAGVGTEDLRKAQDAAIAAVNRKEVSRAAQ